MVKGVCMSESGEKLTLKSLEARLMKVEALCTELAEKKNEPVAMGSDDIARLQGAIEKIGTLTGNANCLREFGMTRVDPTKEEMQPRGR